MITVGTDSYVTVAEATAYIEAHCPSTDERRQAWAAMEDGDREIYLRNAAAAMNRVAFRGVVFELGQSLAFPRYFGPDYRYGPDGKLLTAEEPAVPEEIKAAQVEEGLELACPGEDTEQYMMLKRGVKAVSYDRYSTTYATPGVLDPLDAVVVSTAAKNLLRPCVGGGFCVC
jgi:hypothetical protein